MEADGSYKPQQVAEMLGLTLNTVYEMCRRKVIPSIRIGRTVRIPTRKYREWLNSNSS